MKKYGEPRINVRIHTHKNIQDSNLPLLWPGTKIWLSSPNNYNITKTSSVAFPAQVRELVCELIGE